MGFVRFIELMRFDFVDLLCRSTTYGRISTTRLEFFSRSMLEGTHYLLNVALLREPQVLEHVGD